MSGCLYQLKLGTVPGEIVEINGPHDRYGIVLKIKPNGYHLIRGTGKEKGNQNV